MARHVRIEGKKGWRRGKTAGCGWMMSDSLQRGARDKKRRTEEEVAAMRRQRERERKQDASH